MFDFFKKKPKRLLKKNVGISKATVYLKTGSSKTITRKGYINSPSSIDFFIVLSEILLKSYLQSHSMYECDDSILIPRENVKHIKITTKDCFIVYEE